MPNLLSSNSVPSEQQGLVVPEFDEDNEEDQLAQRDNLQESGKKTSAWSVFGGKLGAKSGISPSLISLDSENLDLDGNASDTWQGSSISFTTVHQEQYSENQDQNRNLIDFPNQDPNSVIVGMEDHFTDLASQGIRG